jgi:hypothetical protein
VRLNHGVDQTQVDPVLGLWIGALARHHMEWTGIELVVTSLRRATSPWPSQHVVKAGELVTAVDFRRWYLDKDGLAEAFCRFLARHYKTWLGVILEPEWLSPEALERRGGVLKVEPHVHVELRSVEWPVGIL